MNLGLLLKGVAMGMAEAIPGVSGGTIAFITGIYQELLDTIKAFNPQNLRLIVSDPKQFWRVINGKFLFWLLTGMVAGLVTGVLIISHLLENHQSLLWAFFFGLVISSAVLLAKDVQWSTGNIIGGVLGALIAFAITSLAPASGSDHPLYYFFSGVLAISALMLPGISGSFILLLLGLYDQIINGLKAILTEQDFGSIVPLSLFAAGALTGLFSFARVMSYSFKRFPQSTMAVMIGILFGSLGKLWPWKIILEAYMKNEDKIVLINNVKLPDRELYKVISESLVLPGDYSNYADPRMLPVILCLIAGIVIVVLIAGLTGRPAE